MKNLLSNRVAAVAAGAAVLAVVGGGTAVAAGKITGADIQNGTVAGADVKDGTLRTKDLAPRVQERIAAESSAYEGAYYAQASYNKGDTNAGAVATVACEVESDTAVAGGVQVLGLDEAANSRNTPVSSSFPGRMDWSTNTPRADRLDGWIVQFGGNAGAASDKAPEKAVVWALCVPGADIPVEQTYAQVG